MAALVANLTNGALSIWKSVLSVLSRRMKETHIAIFECEFTVVAFALLLPFPISCSAQTSRISEGALPLPSLVCDSGCRSPVSVLVCKAGNELGCLSVVFAVASCHRSQALPFWEELSAVLPSQFVSYELGLTGERSQPRSRCPWSRCVTGGSSQSCFLELLELHSWFKR